MKKLLKFICIWGLFFSSFAYSFKNGPVYSFKNLTTADGLSSSTSTAICQDRNGNMWFGTFDGLNKFDGSEITVYRHDKNNPYSIIGNAIYDIYEDRKGNLWIVAKGGLNLYNASTGQLN